MEVGTSFVTYVVVCIKTTNYKLDGMVLWDWEPRQPQDFVRGVADIQAPKWARPEQADSFIILPVPTGPSILNGAALNGFGMNT